jgi:hypothetical protein
MVQIKIQEHFSKKKHLVTVPLYTPIPLSAEANSLGLVDSRKIIPRGTTDEY